MRVVGCVEFGHSNARRSSQSTPAHAERTVAQPERAGAALARARECAGARGGQHARQRSAQVPPCRRKRVVPESPWFITQLIPVHERGPARGATSEHVESATTGSTRNGTRVLGPGPSRKPRRYKLNCMVSAINLN
jgi:hypothetical protein